MVPRCNPTVTSSNVQGVCVCIYIYDPAYDVIALHGIALYCTCCALSPTWDEERRAVTIGHGIRPPWAERDLVGTCFFERNAPRKHDEVSPRDVVGSVLPVAAGLDLSKQLLRLVEPGVCRPRALGGLEDPGPVAPPEEVCRAVRRCALPRQPHQQRPVVAVCCQGRDDLFADLRQMLVQLLGVVWRRWWERVLPRLRIRDVRPKASGLQNAMTSSRERMSAEAEGYRIERDLMDCVTSPSKGGGRNPSVSSSRFSVAKGILDRPVVQNHGWSVVVPAGPNNDGARAR